MEPKPCKIVLLDDEEWMTDLYRVTLVNWFPSLTLLAFQNRVLGWQHLLHNDPDLLITDLNHDKSASSGANGRKAMASPRFSSE